MKTCPQCQRVCEVANLTFHLEEPSGLNTSRRRARHYDLSEFIPKVMKTTKESRTTILRFSEVRMKRSIICLVLLFIVSSSALGQKVTKTNERTKRLFAGSWIADLEKSQRDPNHQFSGLTIKFEFVDETVLLTYSGINKSGNAEGATRKLHPDGKERPIPE